MSGAYQSDDGQALMCSCGSAELFSVAPGDECERALGRFRTSRGVPVVGLCFGCWARRYGPAAARVSGE